MRRDAGTTTSAREQPGGREHWNTFSAQKGACQCRLPQKVSDLDGRADGRQHRGVSSILSDSDASQLADWQGPMEGNAGLDAQRRFTACCFS